MHIQATGGLQAAHARHQDQRTERWRQDLSVHLVTALLCLATALPAIGVAGEPEVRVDVDWKTFLARHDLVWDSMSRDYLDSPFVGNGLLGAMLAQEGPDSLKLNVGRTDVTEHVSGPGVAHYIGKARLPIGAFQLKLPGRISGGKMRLDLYQAETRGRVATDRGEVAFRLFTHAEQPVIVFEWRLAEKDATVKLQRIPEPAKVPRGQLPGPVNPAPTIGARKGVNTCVQHRNSGGDYTTAWREVTLEDGTHRLFVSIADRFPEGGSVDEAVVAVERAAGADFDAFVQAHRAWWKAYYPASFVSIPHPKMESFYWIQIYKLGSAIRKGGPMCDLMGPWYKDTRWPAIWWNLNTQMLYSPFPIANRLEMAENLSDMLLKHRANLIANVPEVWRHDSAGISRCTGPDLLEQYDRWQEKANLVWVCHNLWIQYRCTMDDTFLRNELYPLLRRAVNTYLHQLQKDDQGVYHIPEGHSPEAFTGTDTNYDLASLRWGCKTLLRITKRLGIEDELAERWQDVLDHLTPYAQDETGYMGGPDHPAPRGHRHWSHLLMIYPYYEVNWDQPEHRDVIRRSCRYWCDPGVRNAWSQAVMSSMQSTIGNGDGALLHMERALNSRHLAPNTMHYEGKVFPCSETHGGMCQMLQDMLIQSWGDKIRVFPGVPGAWKDAVFHDLRAEGAFLVSAVRKEGKTAWIHVQSLAGEPCVVQADFGGETPKVLASREMKLTSVSPGAWSLDIKKGESAVLYAGADVPSREIAPLPMAREEMNRYGLPADR